MAPRAWCVWRPLVALSALVAMVARPAGAANILCILTTPTKSHHIWSSPMVEALAARGYNLTVVSPTAMKPPRPNITDLVIEGSLDYQGDQQDYYEATEITPLQWIPYTFVWYTTSCNYTMHTKGVRQLYDYPDDFRFDLIIIEATGGECLLGFIEKFGRPPVVAINGFGNPQWINWMVGNPDNPAYVSNAQLTLQWPFSFWDKVKNVGMYLATLHYYYWHYLPENDDLLKKYFAGTSYIANAPSVTETLSNVSILLVNAHYSLDGARPFVPAMVPIAGIHIKEPKPLPKDLQQFLDGADEGAVYFSLGSLIRSDQLGEKHISAIVEAFNQLPSGVRVLWKWESDQPPGRLPPNVRTGKWLPQSDILAHPNVRVFVSHAGMLSTHEATWRGVPVVALPFIVDQFLNAKRLEGLGVAERLSYSSFSKEKFLRALTNVLTDPGYRERMRALSALFRSRPLPPMDSALFWIEHVLRHGGAPRLRCPTVALPWFALWQLDVLAAVGAGAAAAALLLGGLACAARRRLRAPKSKAE